MEDLHQVYRAVGATLQGTEEVGPLEVVSDSAMTYGHSKLLEGLWVAFEVRTWYMIQPLPQPEPVPRVPQRPDVVGHMPGDPARTLPVDVFSLLPPEVLGGKED